MHQTHPATLPRPRRAPPSTPPPDRRAHASLRWGLLWLGAARISPAIDAMIDDQSTTGITILTSTPPPANRTLAMEWVTARGEMKTVYGMIDHVRSGLRSADPRQALFVSTCQTRES